MRSFVKQCTILAVVATTIGAQVPAGRAEGTMPPPRSAQGVPRESLEARVRSRMTQVVRTQLGLTDEQARRLAATNQRLDGRRRALVNQEREARASLRVQLDRGDSANAAQVSTLLDRMLQLQRSRLELMEEEQRDLQEFNMPRSKQSAQHTSTTQHNEAARLLSATSSSPRRTTQRRADTSSD